MKTLGNTHKKLKVQFSSACLISCTIYSLTIYSKNVKSTFNTIELLV